MRTRTGSVSNNRQATTQAYSPSVPLSVYRDLAAELQGSQVRIDELAAQNEKLAQENQILRQEIAQAVQSFLHLQKLVDSDRQPSLNLDPHSYSDLIRETKHPAHEARQRFTQRQNPSSPVVPWSNEINSPMPETFFIEEQEVQYDSLGEPDAVDISGWRLAITILLIILMGFGAGYLIVRPLFEHHSR